MAGTSILPAGALYVFGSHARYEAKAIRMSTPSLTRLPIATLDICPSLDEYQTIQKAFGKDIEVGYSTRTGLSPYIVGDVEREAVRIF